MMSAAAATIMMTTTAPIATYVTVGTSLVGGGAMLGEGEEVCIGLEWVLLQLVLPWLLVPNSCPKRKKHLTDHLKIRESISIEFSDLHEPLVAAHIF
jgi:hypothetical protein